ncbi:MAG: hypothetical protein NT011_08590 [Kiritimatiellaeota bacterium]|nr:hypothetical protein [Kiritimatiellota bacterium]
MGYSLALAGEPRVSIVAQEPWADFLGGKEILFHFAVSSEQAMTGRVGWRFSCGDRTLARQEREIAPSPGKTEILEIRVQMPEVKDGVILPAILVVSMTETGADKSVAAVEKKIWIYPENPFVDRKEWLKKLNIRLFDPEKKTRECFEKAGIPFQRVNNCEALSEMKDGIIIVGEGASLNDFKGLSGILFTAAARGVPVLCLAPSGGTLSLPGAGENELPCPRSIGFYRNDIITRMDKRLDADAWPPDGVIAGTAIAIKSMRGTVVGEVEKGHKEWPWLEMTFDNPQNKFILCHFAIIEKWGSSPAPRFLLARILEYLTSFLPAKD